MKTKSPHGLLSLIILGLAIGGAACENKKDNPAKEQARLRAGFAIESISPILTETEWEDYNGNGLFDGNINKPAGDPADCGAPTCDEPFIDVNGNGFFDAVWMAGGSRGSPIVKIHDDVLASCFALDYSDERVIFCSVDLIGIFRKHSLQMRQGLRARGVDFDHFVIASTHNHNSPDTMGLWGPNLTTTGINARYLKYAMGLIIDTAEKAVQNLEPVDILTAAGNTDELDRTFEQNADYRAGYISDLRDPHIIDETMTIIRFDKAGSDQAIFSIVHWAAHPEMHNQNELAQTSDFPNYLREELVRKTGTPTIYLNGPLGGMASPLRFRAPVLDEAGEILLENGEPIEAENRSWDQLRSHGTLLGRYAADLYAKVEPVELPPSLEWRVYEFFLPVENIVLGAAYSMNIVPGIAYTADGEQIPEGDIIPIGAEIYAKTEVSLINFGPFGILAVPGEVFPENWIGVPEGVNDPERRDEFWRNDPANHVQPYHVTGSWKKLVEAPIPLMIGLANDEIGYIVPADDFSDLHYEEDVSLGPQTERLINDAIIHLIDSTPPSMTEQGPAPSERAE